MRIVEFLPAKKTKWRMAKLFHPDGRVAWHVGGDDLSNANNARWQLRTVDGQPTYKGARVEFHPNFVFEAWVRPAWGLADRDDDYCYPVNPTEYAEMFTAVVDGRLPVQDGHFHARFTFTALSGKITVKLHGPPGGGSLAAAPADAPDLSDFVKTLGREG